MQHEILIHHSAGKVVPIGFTTGKMRLLEFNRNKMLAAFHIAGTTAYSGLGRPRKYHPSRIEVFQVVKVNPLDNEREIITVGSPVLKWDVKA